MADNNFINVDQNWIPDEETTTTDQAQQPDPDTVPIDQLPAILSQSQQRTSPQYTNHVAMQTAIVAGGVGQDPMAARNQALTSDDPESEYFKVATQKMNQDLEDTDNYFAGQLNNPDNTERLPTLVQDYHDVRTEVSNEYSGYAGTERALVNTIFDPTQLPMLLTMDPVTKQPVKTQNFDLMEQVKKNAEVNLMISNDWQKTLDDSGSLGKYNRIATFTKGLLLNELVLGGAPQELTDKAMAENKPGASNILGGFSDSVKKNVTPTATAAQVADVRAQEGGITLASVNQLQQIVLNWSSLSPERKAEEWPTMKQRIIDASGGDLYEAGKWVSRLLDPSQGDSIKQEVYTNRVLLGLQAVGGLSAVSRVLTNVTRATDAATNAVRLAGEVGNTKLASNLATSAIVEPTGQVADGIKLSKPEAVQMGIPLDLSKFDDGFVPGLAPDIQKNVAEYVRNQAVREQALSPENRLSQTFLTPEESAQAAQKQLDNFVNEQLDAYNNTGVKALNANYTNLTDQGATLNVTLDTGNNQQIVSKNVLFTRNEVSGTYDWKEISDSSAVRYVFSPAYVFGKALGNDLSRYMSAYYESGYIKKILRTSFDETGYFKLPAASKGKLDNVLIAGDEFVDPTSGIKGKTFTPDELRGGVDTPTGKVTLDTPQELETYYKWRAHTAFLGRVDNQIARRELDVEGYKMAHFTDEAPTLIKPYDKGTAKAQITTGEIRRVFDDSTQKMISGDELAAKLDDAYANGYRLSRVRNDDLLIPNVSNGESIRYVLTRESSIKNLPEQVVDLYDGYVPRIYKNEFFVKKEVPHTVNGSEIRREELVRIFDSKRDAEAFAQNLRNTDPNKAIYNVRSDREQSFAQSIGEVQGSRGGLIFGSRKTENPAFGRAATRPDRISAIEAIDRNMNVIASQLAKNEIIMAMQQKMINTVREAGMNISSFYDIRKLATNTTKEGQKLYSLFKTIESWSGIASRDERIYSGFFQSLHDWVLEGLRAIDPSKESVKSLLWMKHTDPVGAARAASFHLYLGLFQPANIFVQSFQALIPFSRNPIAGTRALAALPVLNMLEFSGSGKLIKSLSTTKAIQKLGLTEDFISDMIKGWDQSGLKYAAKMNDNYDLVANGIGITKNSIKKVLDAGTIPYNAGVNFGNKISYLTNFFEWKAANKGKTLDKIGLSAIMKNTDRDLFHMQNANRAAINEGVLSVPTQFTQIIFRTVEALIGKEFTVAEKARIFAGQMLLFGSSGLGLRPVVDSVLRANGMDPSQLEGTNQQVYQALSQGILGWSILKGFGMDIAISDRVAVMNGITKFVQDLLFDDRPLWSTLLGAFGSVADKSYQTLSRLKNIAWASYESGSLTKEDFIMAAQELGQLPASTRNLMKAWTMLNHGVIADKNNLPVISRDFSMQEAIAQALGFQLTEVSRVYELADYNRKRSDMIQAHANTIVYFLNNYVNTWQSGDDPDYNKRMSAVFTMQTQGLNPQEKADVMTAVKNKIFNPKSKQEQNLNTFFKKAFPTELFANLLQTQTDVQNNPNFKVDDTDYTIGVKVNAQQ